MSATGWHNHWLSYFKPCISWFFSMQFFCNYSDKKEIFWNNNVPLVCNNILRSATVLYYLWTDAELISSFDVHFEALWQNSSTSLHPIIKWSVICLMHNYCSILFLIHIISPCMCREWVPICPVARCFKRLINQALAVFSLVCAYASSFLLKVV